MTGPQAPTEARTHWRKRLWAALLAVGSLLGLLILYARSPEVPGAYPTCPFRLLTGGLLCPGCGSMRMLHALLHGRIFDAFAYNPLGFLALPILPCLWWHWARVALRGDGGNNPPMASAAFLRLLVVLIVAFGVLRNVIALL